MHFLPYLKQHAPWHGKPFYVVAVRIFANELGKIQLLESKSFKIDQIIALFFSHDWGIIKP
jgi:hypothetical protein